MSSVLIVTTGQDTHAALVAAALKITGNCPLLWYSSNYPHQQGRSIRISESSESLALRDGFGEPTSVGPVDAVWLRRPKPPAIDWDCIHRDDRDFLLYSSRMYNSALWTALPDLLESERCFWVNAPESAASAENKIAQLLVARRLGWRVPNTLISNSEDDVLAFIREASGKVVRKSFLTYAWQDERAVKTSNTSLVTADDVLAGDVSCYSDIYQEFIDKKSEVRVVFFGNQYYAVEVANNQDETLVDFRRLHSDAKALRMITLDNGTIEKCRRLMREMGLCSATIEFAIDTNGDEVFLECNQAGQFLWLINYFPELPLLQDFVEFLLSGDPEYSRRSLSNVNPAVASTRVFNSQEYADMWRESESQIWASPCPPLLSKAIAC